MNEPEPPEISTSQSPAEDPPSKTAIAVAISLFLALAAVGHYVQPPKHVTPENEEAKKNIEFANAAYKDAIAMCLSNHDDASYEKLEFTSWTANTINSLSERSLGIEERPDTIQIIYDLNVRALKAAEAEPLTPVKMQHYDRIKQIIENAWHKRTANKEESTTTQ